MTVKISANYAGNKRVELLHQPSGTTIQTAAPVDNNGDGSSFSPTDLFAGSLGACMLTIMGICAEKNGINFDSARVELEKHMSADPRRVSAVPLEFHLPAHLSQTERETLEQAALACPVCQSYGDFIARDVTFTYDL